MTGCGLGKRRLPLLLVLTSTFPRWAGDSEPRFVYDLCMRLKGSFRIEVLAPHALGCRESEWLEGIQVRRFRYAPSALEKLAYEGGIGSKLKSHKRYWLLVPLFFLGQWLAIRTLLKKHPVAAIHAHWLIPQGMLACAQSARPPVLCTSHGGDLFGMNDPLSRLLKRWTVKRADAVAVVSTAMAGKLDALGGSGASDVPVMPMGADLSGRFVPDPDVKRKRAQLLFVGRLVEKKGLVHLIQAMQLIAGRHPDARLYIAGSGPEQNRLSHLTEKLGLLEQVIFLGRRTHQELVRLYQESAVAVFPFVRAGDGDMEGLGLVMLEAMGCECPVIASDLPAVRSVLVDGKTGLLAEPGDPASLGGQVDRLLSSPGMAERLGKSGRSFALEHFDWPVCAGHYERFLAELMENSGP